MSQQLAQRWRDLKPTPTERLLDPKRVQYIKERVESGFGVPFHWADMLVKSTGEMFRANGQHSSEALVQLDGKMPLGLKAHIDHYEVPDMHGAVMLFRQIDPRQSARTTRDVAGVYQGIVHNLEKVDRKTAKLGIDGIGWWRRQIEGVPTPSGDDIYDLFNETGLHSFLNWLGETITLKTRELEVAQVVAAMYATFNAGEEQARQFWHNVARNGVEYEENHPTTVLDQWLQRRIKEEMKLKPGEIYQGCIYAWNAAREGKSIREIKYDIRKGFLRAI
jgi:hypothetical protein